MKTIATSFATMSAAIPPEIRQEIDLEFAVSNRFDELMKKYGYTKLQLDPKKSTILPSENTKYLSAEYIFATYSSPII